MEEVLIFIFSNHFQFITIYICFVIYMRAFRINLYHFFEFWNLFELLEIQMDLLKFSSQALIIAHQLGFCSQIFGIGFKNTLKSFAISRSGSRSLIPRKWQRFGSPFCLPKVFIVNISWPVKNSLHKFLTLNKSYLHSQT